MNVTNIRNQQQGLIRQRLAEIYTHERAHKAKGGSLTGPIVIDWKNSIPIGGHVSIKIPLLNPKNPKKTIEEANTMTEEERAEKLKGGKGASVDVYSMLSLLWDANKKLLDKIDKLENEVKILKERG